RHSRIRPGAASRRGSAHGRARPATEAAIGISAHAVATVDDAFELADRSRQLTGNLEIDIAGDAEAFLDPGGHEAVEAFEFDGADAFAGLDFDGHLVHPTRAGEDELEVRAENGELEEHGFDIGRVDVDSADDHQIVRAAGDARDAAEVRAGGARQQGREIVGAVPDD